MSATGHSLPSIPSLPPLHMPTDVPFTPSDPYDRESVTVTRNSSTSRQSFSTALTSSRQGTPVITESNELRAPSPSSLSTPLGLRKSLSVDSFVQYSRETTSKAGSRPNRVQTSPGCTPQSGQPFEASTQLKQEADAFRWSSQLRGASVGGESDQAFLGNSDIERSDSINLLSERGRRVLTKSHEKNKSPIYGGELPLPSRTPTLSLPSNANTREYAPRLQTASSMQSIPRRGANTLTGITTGRARSGSLGVYVTHSGKPMLINTRVVSVSSRGICKWHSTKSHIVSTIRHIQIRKSPLPSLVPPVAGKQPSYAKV